MIAKFEFEDTEQEDIVLCTHRREMWEALKEINSYRRSLDKYEERNEIPTSEVERKLTVLLEIYYEINGLIGG